MCDGHFTTLLLCLCVILCDVSCVVTVFNVLFFSCFGLCCICLRNKLHIMFIVTDYHQRVDYSSVSLAM